MPERMKISRLLWMIPASLGILLIVVTVLPLVEVWTAALSAPWAVDIANDKDAILIVLGGDIVAPDMIGMSSFWRSVYAVREWRTGRYGHIVLSGKAIAPLMQECLVSQGVPAAAIQLETDSQSTRENAVDVAALLKRRQGTQVLLTSDFHMGRALAAFRKAGLEVRAMPIPDARKRAGDWRERWGIFWTLVDETEKVIYYKAQGWV